LAVPAKRSPARLIVALSVAAALAVFLVYTSIAGGGTPQIQPSQLGGHSGRVSLGGIVVGPKTGDAHGRGLFFKLRDRNGTAMTRVQYRGSVPDLFKVGREVVVDGRMRGNTFVAVPGTLVTKCPSKYSPKK
jgi:cytochrome c-type biogenesis protein CcmE